MKVRIGVNGFGRMGRLALRAAWNWPEIEFVHINEPLGGAAAAAHLLEFDSVHGRWPQQITMEAKNLRIDGRRVTFSEHARPGDVPWREHNIDLVLECSGKFRTMDALRPYFAGGVQKVIVAAPVKEGA